MAPSLPLGRARLRAFLANVATLVLIGLLLGSPLRAQTISVQTEQELRDAIAGINSAGAMEQVTIFLTQSLQLTELGKSGTALPPITGNVRIVGLPDVTLNGGGMGTDFRAFSVANGGILIAETLTLRNFHVSGNGGCIAVAPGGRFGTPFTTGLSNQLQFIDCHADGLGGALYAADAEVGLAGEHFENCSASFGGAVALDGGASAVIARTVFRNNRASEGGGAIHTRGQRLLPDRLIRGRAYLDCEFDGNHSDGLGGALDFRNGNNRLRFARFGRGSADIFGCYINNDSSPFAPPNIFSVAQINDLEDGTSRCMNTHIEIPRGATLIDGSTLHRSPDRSDFPRLIDSTGQTELAGNVLDANPLAPPQAKANCADFGSGAIRSVGGNLSSDNSCFLTEPSDLVSSDSLLLAADDNGILALPPGSPGIERGAHGVLLQPTDTGTTTRLPCSYRDIRGLGRPQDADGDGVYACDSGAWELQAGPDLGPAQSGIYFDPTRSGEGHFVELIGGGAALVSTFTYGLEGGMAWFIGVGSVVGNSIVVEQMLGTRGGVFGPDFDEGTVERYPVGGLSLVYADCEATTRPGHFAFGAEPGAGFEDVATAVVRLAAIVPCAGQASPLAWRSGAWYPVSRSGEGLFVQYLPDGRAVLVYYGYTPSGEQFWAFSDDGVSIDGNVLTVPLLYPAATTRFGRGFSAAEVDLQPFGTLTMTQIDCDHASVLLAPTLDGFVGGSYEYLRLTRIEGTQCPAANAAP